MLDEPRCPKGVRARAHRTFRRLATPRRRCIGRRSTTCTSTRSAPSTPSPTSSGSAAALDYLGAEVVVSPLPMGRGFASAAHGTLPLPAPATVECLAGLATYDAGIDFELVTPTGAAIVGAHATGSQRWPSMAPERIGWGAGTRRAARSTQRPPRRARRRHSARLRRDEGKRARRTRCSKRTSTTRRGELAASWIERSSPPAPRRLGDAHHHEEGPRRP